MGTDFHPDGLFVKNQLFLADEKDKEQISCPGKVDSFLFKSGLSIAS